MKVAVFCESSADEAAIRLLVNGLLGADTEPVDLPRLRARGWPAIREAVPSVAWHTYYKTQAEALIVVADSNGTPVHQPQHENDPDPQCRLCIVRSLIQNVQRTFRPVIGRQVPRVALGLAVPCIEAWFHCGRDSHVNEANWIKAEPGRNRPYDSRKLKKTIYGTPIPTLELETEKMREEATRLVQDLTKLEAAFPNGFGALVKDVREWRSP